MVEWKIGKTFSKGYLLKVMCIEDAKTLAKDSEERMYQLVLLKKGTAIFNINGKNIAVTSPSVFCLNDSDQVTCMSQQSEHEMDIINFHPSVINHLFDCDNVITGDVVTDWKTSINQDRILLTPFYERKAPYIGCLSIEVNAFNRIMQLFHKMKAQISSESDDFWPCRSRSFFIEILIILEMRYYDKSTPDAFLVLSESQQEINDVLDYIHTNYSNKITIELLTKEFNINRNSLNQRFAEVTGYTPISYLIEYRLKVAESLLVNTQIPVHEICERVGFSELSNFMKSFKKKYGETPANYRTLYTTMW